MSAEKNTKCESANGAGKLKSVIDIGKRGISYGEKDSYIP
jgi:hypothetical protein